MRCSFFQMRLSSSIIALTVTLALCLSAETLRADPPLKIVDPGALGPGKGVIQQQGKPIQFPPGAIQQIQQPKPPGGQQKPGGLNLPSTWDYIHGFGRAGMDALGRVRGWRGGGGRPWRSGYGQGWRTYYGDPDAGYYYPDEYAEPEYPDSDLPPNQLPPTAPQLTPNSLPGQTRVLGAIRPIEDDFVNFRGGAIVNPPDSRTELHYMLDGVPFMLPPGHYQDLGMKRRWVVQFDRGGPYGAAKYSIGGAKHIFTPTKKGWELYRD